MSQIQVQQSKYEEFARILETTSFRQIQNRMHNDNGYCAIGVIVAELGSSIGIPTSIYNQILSLNDFEGKSFKEIAAWLREQK